MPLSNMQETYPGIETRDTDWRGFFHSQIWKDLQLIIRNDYEYGLSQLLGEKVQGSSEIDRLRGKVAAYKEIENLDENILAIIAGTDEEEIEEDGD